MWYIKVWGIIRGDYNYELQPAGIHFNPELPDTGISKEAFQLALEL
jgi:hypothetical protein